MAGFVYPPLSFHFKVEIDGFPGDIGFQSVEGLNVTVPDIPYAEGGENTFTHRFPDRIKYTDLTLKRGMLLGSDLIQWFDNALQFFIFAPRDVTVTLQNGNNEALEQWVFRNAWPKGWNIENFDSSNGKVAVESIILTYQYFYRKGLTPPNT
jgi:phage tail-like protein